MKHIVTLRCKEHRFSLQHQTVYEKVVLTLLKFSYLHGISDQITSRVPLVNNFAQKVHENQKQDYKDYKQNKLFFVGVAFS